MQDLETKKELSPAEIKAMQEKMDKFYDERLPFLEKQCKYEELTSRIELARFNRNEAMYKMGQLAAHLQDTDAKKQPVEIPKL